MWPPGAWTTWHGGCRCVDADPHWSAILHESTRCDLTLAPCLPLRLQTLSLGQYREAFVDAAIDGSFLYDLTEDDLKNSLGPCPMV